MKNPTAQLSLALLLARAERYVTDRLDDALRGAGLTVDQYRVLLQLVEVARLQEDEHADDHGHGHGH